MKHFTILKSFLLLFALVVGSNVWAEDPITFNLSGTNAQPVASVSSDPVTITFAKGTGNTAPTWYDNGSALRFYSGNTITFESSGAKIEKVILTNTQAQLVGGTNGANFPSEGTYSETDKVETWTPTTALQSFTVNITNKPRLTTIEVYLESSGGSGTEKADCDLTLIGAPVALSFDLYDNADAKVINYTTSSTGTVTVVNSEYINAVVGEGTITVTPLKKTNGAVEITVNQAADDDYKAGSATFTVTIDDSTPKTGAWELTALADLEEGDVFVIVGNNGSNYAMSNDNGTGSAPAAVSVTVEDDEITSDVDDNIKWNISGNATDGYTFYPDGDDEKWLYCTNSNNGVRVGTNTDNTFNISDGYLYHSGTSRYVGIYNSSDWRCYTSINNNIKDQTFAFYKYVDGTTPQKADPELSFSPSEVNINFGDQFTAPTLNTAEGFNGTVEYSSSVETVAEVMDTETGELRIVGGGTTVITATFAGNDTFKSGSASYTLTVTDNRIATTITQENITLDITEVATLTQLTPVVKDADENVIAYTYEGFPPTVSYDLVSDENGIIGSMDYNSGEITLNGVVGTATLKAYYNIYNVNDTYKPSECTFSITVVDPGQITTYTLATSITPGKHYIITNGTDAAIGEQKTNNRAAVGIAIEEGTATVASNAGVSEFIIYGPDANNHYTIYDTTANKEGYLYAAAPSNNNMKLQSTNNINGKWTIEFGNEGVASVVADESSNRNVMRYNASSSIFSCYAENNNQADVYLFEKDNDTAVETTATVTFNSAGYATFASKNTLDFLDAENANYSAWQITSAGATDITFDQINTTVKAGTGILLKGEAGTTATLNILPLGGSDLTNSNKLVGITTETDIEADTYYGLKGKEFVRLTAGTVPAGKAILPAALISSNAPMLSFIFNDGETTKINLNVNDNLDQNAPRYNMAGQRVSNSYKGIVIVNGKKVVIK